MKSQARKGSVFFPNALHSSIPMVGLLVAAGAQVFDNVAVRRLVADNPSMIGYIDRSAIEHSVRPVLVLR